MAGQELTVLFGTHTAGTGNGFSISNFDSRTGALSTPEFVTEAAAPAYFILANAGKRLYTCNSTGFVSAYSVANAGRSLTLLNKVPSEGEDPSYVSLDMTGTHPRGVEDFVWTVLLSWSLSGALSQGEWNARRHSCCD